MLTTKKLDALIGLATLLHQDPEGVCQALADMKEQIKDVTDKDRSQWMRDNYANKQEIAAAVRYKVLVDVMAQLYALSFFENTPLADNEWPIIDVFKRDGQVKVWTVGEAGGAPRRQRVDRRTHTTYLLSKFSTDLYEYQLMDLQIGNVQEMDRVTAEVSYELGLAIDALALNTLNAASLTSGLRATLNLHRSIVTTNIPDKNKFNFSSTGADDSGDGAGKNGKITVEKCKLILDYFERFSGDVELDGAPLRMKTMYISSRNKRDIWDFTSLVAGFNLSGADQNPQNAIPFDAKMEIYRSGMLESMFGYKFNIVTRNNIAAGTVKISSNKPAGYYFNKPGMAETIMNDDIELRRQNTGQLGMSVVHALVLPVPWTYRYLDITL